MKKLIVTTLLLFGSMSANQRCDGDNEQTTFEQAIANAKKAKQLTGLAGFRIKGDDTTPQEQFDAIVDRIAECLTEANIQAACTNCPFFNELNSVPGLTGSFFVQATDGSADEDLTADDVADESALSAPELATDVEIAAPCACDTPLP